MKRVIVHIDSVAFHGLSLPETDGLGESIRQELGSALADGAAFQQMGRRRHIPVVRTPQLSFSEADATAALGAGIAHSLVGSQKK